MAKLKIFQINLKKNYSRTVDMLENADKNRVNFTLIQEPYTLDHKIDLINEAHYTTLVDTFNKTPNAIILIRRNRLIGFVELNKFSNDWMVACEISINNIQFILASIYLNKRNEDKSRRNLDDQLSLVQKLIDKAATEKKKLIISASLNCESYLLNRKINDTLTKSISLNKLAISNKTD